MNTLPLGLPLGFHRDVPNAIYHQRSLGLVSKGALDELSRSPLHYRSWLTEPDEDTPALVFGRAFHCALLEPARFVSTYAVEPDFGDCRKTDRTTKEDAKENKTLRDAWRVSFAGCEFLSDHDYAAIRGMVASVHSHELAGLMIRDGEPELTITWRDKETGLGCKIRPDYYVRNRSMCVDAKSTLDASVDSFSRDVAKYRYHVQDALYRAGFAGAGESIEHFVFVAVEKLPPYAVAIHTLDSDGIGRGYMRARTEIDLLAECMKSDRWPGYEPTIHTISVPPWAA